MALQTIFGAGVNDFRGISRNLELGVAAETERSFSSSNKFLVIRAMDLMALPTLSGHRWFVRSCRCSAGDIGMTFPANLGFFVLEEMRVAR